jgi:ferrous-iron efflux pump FieF
MSTDHSKLLKLATYASMTTALSLIVAKLVAWILTGSVSILASLIDSLMDAGASLVNLLAVRYSLLPADEEHRFGHGKAEALAGLAQAMFITGSAVFLLLHAGDRLLNPQPITELGIGMAIILFAMLATTILLTIQRHVIKQTKSTAIRADALHYATDLATNGATLLALILAYNGFPGLDPVFAIGIALYILYSAIQIARDAIQLLMDKELPGEEREQIKAIVLKTPGVLGMHGLRTWQSGLRKVIQLHLELDQRLSLREAHKIAMDVEMHIRATEPQADVTIHQDPAGEQERDRHNPGDMF